jgi:hypothetical protein
MAEHAVIDRYLSELEREVRWFRDAEEIIEEVADHLLEAVAVHTRRGLDRIAAQKRALTEFGDPTLVGRAFASTRSGGIAMPTEFTRRSGVALVASSFLWLVALGFIYWSDVADRTRPWEGLPMALYLIGTFTLIAAGALLAIGILGINRRHGGALGNTGRLAFWIAALTGVTAFGSWAWGVWLTLFGIGAIVLAIAVHRSEIAPRTAGLLVGIGGGLAAGAAWVFQLTSETVSLGSGAFTAWIFAGLVIYSVGLASLGMWLKTEEPVDQPDPIATA